MTTRDIIALVAGREIRDRIRNRAFVLGTGAALLVMIGFLIVPSLFDSDETPTFDLGVVGEVDPLFFDAIASAATAQDIDVDLFAVEDEAAASDAVVDGDADAVLVDRDHLLVEGNPDRQLRSVVDQARQQSSVLEGLADAGIDAGEASSLLAGRPPVDVITPTGTEEDTEGGQAFAFVATVLLFLIVQMNGSSLLTGAIEEKSSRVVEVLLGSVRPWQLLSGKLLGIMVLAVGQLVLFVGTALGANLLVDAFDVPAATASAVGVGSLMFVMGFAFYAALYAVAGSMASSLEDAQAVAGPLAFLTGGAYIGTLIGIVPNPDTIFAHVLTYLPPTAPFAVPARIAVGSIGGLEIAISAVVTGLAAVVTVRVAGRLYSAAILAGGKLTWRQVWRAEPV